MRDGPDSIRLHPPSPRISLRLVLRHERVNTVVRNPVSGVAWVRDYRNP